MTRPRTTTSPADSLGATISDSKSRLINLEALAHRHETVPLAPLNSPTFTGTPRYASLPNPYGWHVANQPLGTEMVIGAYGRIGGSFSAANTWIDIGSVGVTIPSACSVIELVFGFSLFTAAPGQVLVRGIYSGPPGGSFQFNYFSNEGYSHKVWAGTLGMGATGGSSGTVSLQVYGVGITLINDSNDSAYFTVHTI